MTRQNRYIAECGEVFSLAGPAEPGTAVIFTKRLGGSAKFIFGTVARFLGGIPPAIKMAFPLQGKPMGVMSID